MFRRGCCGEGSGRRDRVASRERQRTPTSLAGLRPHRKGVAPTGLVHFFELTPGLRPGLIYAVPTGLKRG